MKASETGALGAGTSSPEVRANKPPVVKVEGAKTLTAKVGQPLTLDGARSPTTAFRSGAAPALPARPSRTADRGATRQRGPRRRRLRRPASAPNRAMLPPARVTVGKNVGLHLSWFVYRGAGAGDLRSRSDQGVGRHARRRQLAVGADLGCRPTMPADGKITVHATFAEPGTYVLRGLADDGALIGGDDVTVTVTP